MRAYLSVITLLLLIFGAIAAFLYNKFSVLSGMDFSPPPIVVNAAVARQATWPSLLEAIGTIRATRGVELSAETSGEIITISVESGANVQAGQAILTLNDSVERASRERQKASLKLARLLYERDASLVRQKSIPQSQYDRSQADLDSAIAQLAETEARLNTKRVVAPFGGTTGIITVKVGDYIESGTPITTLQDNSQLEVDFSVPARYFPQLRLGLTIRVFTDAFPEREFRATLKAIDAKADSGTRNLRLRAQLEESEGLLPGMFARLVIDLDNPIRVVTVPETAVSYSLHGDTVYSIIPVTGGLKVEPQVVVTGGTRDGQIAILNGILAGQRVVTVGQNKLYRDAFVSIKDAPGASQ